MEQIDKKFIIPINPITFEQDIDFWKEKLLLLERKRKIEKIKSRIK